MVRFCNIRMSFIKAYTLNHAYANGKITILDLNEFNVHSEEFPLLSLILLFHHWFYLLPIREIKYSNYSHSLSKWHKVYFPINSNESYVCIPQGAQALSSFTAE